ncbi:precorrin-6Y C5,15-methyltransferase (decarboxylating) subunit CbiT [Clostridium carnis]
MILIKDNEFIRGNCPMTKEDIRALSLLKMELKEDSIVLDVGSGTGTITVQASKVVTNGKVYAIERDEEAYEVTVKNIEKFNCKNINLFKGDASEVLNELIEKKIKFDSIFIGGSGGNIEDIIEKCNELLNINGTIVMNFITLDNAYKAMEYIKGIGYIVDVSLVQISKNRGKSYMMIANNPIYIVKSVRGES